METGTATGTETVNTAVMNPSWFLSASRYGYKIGTSMAAAHIPGVAGLLFTLEKDTDGDGLINDEVRAALENGCDGLNVSALKGPVNAYHAVSSALTSK
jgi:subtilisin family serine protease